MPRILFINSVCGKGSTGRICTDLYDLAVNDGYECCIAYGRGNHPKGYNTFKIGNKIDIYGHVLMTRLFDKHGFGSKFTTKKLLKFIDSYKPDIIHLHNIHGYYLNIKCLCDYLRNNSRIKVIWTLHDCWAFTGHCAYFTFSKCNKWKNDCRNCQYRSSYPSNLLYSNSKKNFDKKKHLFTSLPNLVLVTPSKWLKSIVDDSFLHKYECRVIHNGIDSSIFKNKGKNTENKVTTILGLANIWDERKGFKTFLELAETIKDEDYKIILVGLSKKQIKELPTNILGIERTNNVDELVELYK